MITYTFNKTFGGPSCNLRSHFCLNWGLVFCIEQNWMLYVYFPRFSYCKNLIKKMADTAIFLDTAPKDIKEIPQEKITHDVFTGEPYNLFFR